MKKEEKNIQLVEDEYGVVTITEKNEHLFPKEVVESIRKICDDLEKGKIFAPEKYFASQKEMLLRNTRTLFNESPDLPAKQVLLKIMETLPDFLPAKNLVEVTQIITEEWEKLSKKIAA